MQIGYRSDVGQKREHNEDSVVCLTLDAQFCSGREETGLFVVADGMGGHTGGEIASEFATKMLARECCLRLLDVPNSHAGGETAAEDPGKILVASLCEANKKLFEKSREVAQQGMGTTLTAVLVIGQDLYVINVGDSRCYIINDRETMQITKDHSVVQDLVESELIKPEEARDHPRKNMLTRVVGYQGEVEPDIFQRKLYQGDSILLCSDGLWGVLSDQQITKTVLAVKTPEQACIDLVAKANKMGAPDNISVIIIQPDHLPCWQESLMAETQVIEVSEATKQKPRKGLLSVFRRKAP